MAESHPTVTELLDYLERLGGDSDPEPHLEHCLICRVRLSRLRDDHGYTAPGEDVIARLRRERVTLSEAIRESAVASSTGATPERGELWRVGRDQALIVWVRKNIAPAIVDVVPVVLDTDLADDQTLLIRPDETPLGVGLAVMTSLRTHLHRGAFLNPIGQLAISEDVENLLAGNSVLNHDIGTPIVDPYDQRIEYRQAVADLASDLSPAIWDETGPPATDTQTSDGLPQEWQTELDRIADELSTRTGSRFLTTQHVSVGTFTTMAKATYLDTSVLIVGTHGVENPSGVVELVEALGPLLEVDIDVDAVALSAPAAEWMTVLFTRADLRPAQQTSGGGTIGPRVTLEGMDLLDTLHKHFERAAVAWEVVEHTDRTLRGLGVRETAIDQARAALIRLRTTGGRAHSPKKETWLATPDEVADQVADAITAASDNDIDRAIELLELDSPDD